MLKVIIADDERLICRLVQTLADWDSLGMEVVPWRRTAWRRWNWCSPGIPTY